MPVDIDRNLLPSRLADLAMMRTLDGLMSEVTTGFVVIIRVGSPGDPLAVELAHTYGAGLDGDQTPAVLDFHTQLAQTEDHPTIPPVSRSGAQELQAVQRFMLAQCCFAAPLMKRGVSTMTDHITVGRALNKDLVLRAPGVSKLHGWFEVEGDSVQVTDAGSKNGTFVGGQRLDPRTPTTLPAGESVTFSTIEVVLCSTTTFWNLLRSG